MDDHGGCLADKTISLADVCRSSGGWRIKAIKIFDHVIGGLVTALLIARKTKPFPDVDAVHRMLVIRPGGIGDAVFLIPLLKRIHERFPKIQVDVLCERRNAAVFQEGRHCHAVYCYDKVRSFFRVPRHSYEVVIDTEQWHYLSGLTAYFFRSAVTVGFATRPWRRKLFHVPVVYGQALYELKNFKRLFAGLGEEVFQDIQDINETYELPEYVVAWAAQQQAERPVALYLGTSIPEKRLSVECCRDIVQALRDRDISVILVGGRDALASASFLEKYFPDGVTNFTGRISLLQTAALIKQSRFFIGSDSGIMHLACAVGTPVITVFGPSDTRKWGPQGERHVVISKNFSCWPCTIFGYTIPTCRNPEKCMAWDAGIVIDEINRFVK